jgi:lysophospholipase L1-like esterase
VGRLSSPLATLAAVSAVFAVAEVALRVAYAVRNALLESVPLPYLIGGEYGPAPPWTDRLGLLEPDPALIWKARPKVHREYVDVFRPAATEADRLALRQRFLPGLPPELRDAPRWEVTLDAEGFRDGELAASKSEDAFRIVCLGDSWTFGANVDDAATYPRRLADRLGRAFPHGRFEVRNLGVMGYSSHQGLELLRRRALALQPDVVVLGFAMNDSKVAGYRDEEVTARPAPWARRLERGAEHLETFKLLRYVAQRIRYVPRSPSEELRRAEAAGSRAGEAAWAGLAEWTRVPLDRYEANVRAMIDAAGERGAEVVLLYNEFWREGPYRAVLARIARERSLPFVDASELMAAAQRETQRQLELELGLRPAGPYPGPPGDDRPRVVFRVSAAGHPVPKALYVAGLDPALGAGVPNAVALHDDGSFGDEKANDGVWSYAAALGPGASIAYVYTNSGRTGRWEGLDVPAVRRFEIDPETRTGTLYRPVESFGRLTLHADAWHPDASGYAMIADAVFDALETSGRFTAYLQHTAQRTRPGA